MEPSAHTLRLYGRPSDSPPLHWDWVDGALRDAGTYWVVAPSRPPGAHPHPRPVWGVWAAWTLALSVGSPTLARLLEPGAPATVHLDSGTDVVIVQGTVAGPTDAADLVARYEAKYDWTYALDEYGPLTAIAPTDVLAWRSSGWAGRDGFRQTGRWRLRAPDDPVG
jgi:hypothetical protein